MAEDLGTLRGRIVLDVKQALGAYREVRQQHQNLIFSSRQVGDAMVQSGQQMLGAGTVMVAGFAAAVSAAATFERKMDFFQAVTNTSTKEMLKLNDAVLKMAQDSIFSGDQVADGIVELGKAGVSAQQIMEGVGDAMINLGAAGDIPLAQSGQIITSVVQQFDLAASDATKIADKLAGAANASIVEIDDLGVSLKYVGGVASAAGLSFEDVNDALGILGKAGIRGSTAGTSLRQMIVSLGGATKPARKALMEIGVLTEDGTNKFYDQAGALKPLSQVYQILNDSLDGYSQKERLAYLRTIFNNRALSAAAILTREGAAGFKEMNGEISKTTAADVARKRLDNLSGDVEILKGNIETFMIKAGTPFQSMLRDVVKALTATVQAFGSLPQPVQTGILAFIGITGVLLVLMGIFNIIVGTVIIFASNLARMAGAGGVVKVVFKTLGRVILFLLKPLGLIIKLFASMLLALGPIGLIVVAIVALGVAVFIAYKKSAKFRAIVDGIVDVLQRWGAAVVSAVKPMVDWFMRVVKPGERVRKVFEDVGKYITKLKGLSFGGWVKEIIKVFVLMGTAIPRLFLKLLPIMLKLAGKLGVIILKGLADLLPKMGKLMLNLVFTVVKFFSLLPLRIAQISLRLVTAFLSWALGLVPKLAGLLGLVIGFILGFLAKMVILIAAKSISLSLAFLGWLISLPGKIPGLFVTIVTAVASGIAKLTTFMLTSAARVGSAFIRGISNLPGLLGDIISSIPGIIIGFIGDVKGAAITLGRNLFDGFKAFVGDIPGIMGDIISNVKQVIKDAISSAFNAMKSFGKGMWDGFKKGIGIASPSYVEKAMFALSENTQAETKKLARTTLDVQKLSKKMAATAFGPNMDMSGFRDVAMLQKKMKNGDMQLAAALGLDGSAITVQAKKNNQNPKLVPVEGKMDIGEDGIMTFQGWAKEVYDSEAEYQDSIDRM